MTAPAAGPRVPFGDLNRQHAPIASELRAAAERVMASGWFILGREVETFEREFAVWCGATHCVGCASGAEALTLALAAHDIGPGDTVVTAPNTCVPTAVGIGATGARIALCDADPATALMDARSLAVALRATGAKAVVPVHLYGQPANLDAIGSVAAEFGAVVVEDAAQAHGAEWDGRRVGAHGNTVCWSFYPSKNLGALGDAGAVTTHDGAEADRLRMLRNYGQERRYHHKLRGWNSRLDEMQAALLRAKLPHLDAWNERRRAIAARYRSEINHKAVSFVEQSSGAVSCHHLFPVLCDGRDGLLDHLRTRGIDSLIHYPVAIHLQEAYRDLGYGPGDFPAAESLCRRELSLPMFPELDDAEVERVIAAVNDWTGA